MKLLVDMNLSPAWCGVLKQAGWDAVHWTAVGAPNAADQEILEWAVRQGRVLFTHDLDFGAILAATGATGPSVLQVRTQDVTPAALAETVIRLLHRHAEVLEMGALVSLDEASARMRVLPLRDA